MRVKEAAARFAYSTLLRVATPLYLARLWWRGRTEPAYREHWKERLAWGGAPVPDGAVWIHAVSLGETRAAVALIEELRAQMPGIRLLLTHGTATGRDAGKPLLRAGDRQVWLPYDTPGATRRFMRRHRPSVGVLMETEIWPNLLHAARAEGVPMVLANARLSEKSSRRGRQLAALMRPAVATLANVLAQTADDARRLHEAGARKITIGGNLKFDVTPLPRLVARGLEWRQALARPVVLAASTREGEEVELLHVWSGLPAPRPLLLLVPRHPQRFDDVADMVETEGLRLRRRSQFGDLPPADAEQADVWLGDSIGEMPMYYGASDVALLGGSFAPLGGQNLIEAAACGCPIVMGPHTFNFDQAARLSLAAGASQRVADLREGVVCAVALSIDPNRNEWVQRAFKFAAAHRGAAARMATDILGLRRAG